VVRANRDPRANRVHLVLRGNKDHLVLKALKEIKDRPADNNRLAGPSLGLPTSSLQVVTLLSETL